MNNITDNNSFNQDTKIFSVSEINRMVKDVEQLSKQTDIMYIDGKYNGYLHCGAMSLCTYMVLKEHNIEPNVYKTSRGNYKNREDQLSYPNV